jgi:hypothetical protein
MHLHRVVVVVQETLRAPADRAVQELRESQELLAAPEVLVAPRTPEELLHGTEFLVLRSALRTRQEPSLQPVARAALVEPVVLAAPEETPLERSAVLVARAERAVQAALRTAAGSPVRTRASSPVSTTRSRPLVLKAASRDSREMAAMAVRAEIYREALRRAAATEEMVPRVVQHIWVELLVTIRE